MGELMLIGMKSSQISPIKRKRKVDYNKALARRAELFLDLKVLKNYEKELKQMNKKKTGRRFLYPKCFIEYLALLKVYLRVPYRTLESYMNFFKKSLLIERKPDHSTIHRRAVKLDIDLSESLKHKTNLVISIDSSGLKVHNRGEWIRKVHKVRRGFLKIHVAVNTKTNEIVELDSTRENVHDNRRFRPLVRRIMKKYKIKKILADAAYDDHRNFNLLRKHRIAPAIKLKRNSWDYKWGAKKFDRKHRIRRKYAALISKSYKEWRRRLGYNKRWLSEIVFSSFKNNFGEYFTPKKMENIRKEIVLRAYAHNMIMNDLLKCRS